MELLDVAVAVLALAGLSVLAYALRALDAAGALVSFILGFGVAMLGGMRWLALMVLFTGLGVLATRIGRRTKEERRVTDEVDGERGPRNVIGNGLAPALAAVAVPLEPLVPLLAAKLAFATAVAAVTADTLASEIGALAKRSRRILPPFAVAVPGENGAVSWPGQLAAAFGATAIAAAAIPLLDLSPWLASIPALVGFLGCQLDSVLGATLERDHVREGPLSKQDVNFLSSALPAFAVLVVVSLV